MQAKACFAEQKLPYGMWDTKKELPYGSELYKVGEKIVV